MHAGSISWLTRGNSICELLVSEMCISRHLKVEEKESIDVANVFATTYFPFLNRRHVPLTTLMAFEKRANHASGLMWMTSNAIIIKNSKIPKSPAVSFSVDYYAITNRKAYEYCLARGLCQRPKQKVGRIFNYATAAFHT